MGAWIPRPGCCLSSFDPSVASWRACAGQCKSLCVGTAPLVRVAPHNAPGVKLYHAARLGEEVQRTARPIVVSEYAVWREDPHAQDVSFRVRCSKGTYIRSLAHDLVRCAPALGLGLDKWCTGRMLDCTFLGPKLVSNLLEWSDDV